MTRPAAVGTVASAPDVNGTFTVTAKNWQRGAASTTPVTTTTYTVTTTSATTVTKNGASSTVSSIATGDMVMIQGTVSGTTITATSINDGKMGAGMGRPGGFGGKMGTTTASHMPAITGNGQPIVGGAVTAVNGNSITVTNKSNATYTVDVSSATVSKTGVTGATAESIVVGDNVIVQGTVNGTNITASSVTDSGTAPSSGNASGASHGGGIFGFLGGMFSKMFGFF